MGGKRDIGKRPRAAEREMDNAREIAESLIRQVDEAKGMVREVRDRDINTRGNTIGGLNDDMKNTEKDMEKAQENMGTSGASLASNEVEARMLSSNLNRIR